MNTRLDIDRAITTAEALHDDQAGQVGTGRPRRPRPPQTLLDSHEGDAPLDTAPEDDLGAGDPAGAARARGAYFDLEEPIHAARHAARLAMLALQDFMSKRGGTSMDTLDYAITSSLASAEEVHRRHQQGI